MYIPKHFQEDDISKLHELIQQASFGAMVTLKDGVPLANHFPFILDPQRGPYGTLIGHMARANEQWRTFESVPEALVIFQGPHTYITPSWYDAKLSVPTWNFAAVHAYGKPRIIADEQEMYQLLAKQVQTYESGFEHPWQFDLLPDDYVYKMIRGTVGFEIEITRLEGKYKLSQNRPMNDRIHVAAMLKESQDPQNIEVADLMEERL